MSSNTKRVFDLPTESNNQGPLGPPRNTDPKFQGNSGGIAKRILPMTSSTGTSIEKMSNNLVYGKIPVGRFSSSFGQHFQKVFFFSPKVDS